MKRLMVAVFGLAIGTAAAQAEQFAIDPMHSSVVFTVKHVVGNVTGRFEKFSGTFNVDVANLAKLTAQASIEAASVNTGVQKRDDDLRSDHFFDVQKYPNLMFKSTSVTDVAGSHAKLHGDLTIHGVTKPVVLDLEMMGVAKDPMGPGNRAGATATGKVNRLDFGVGPASGPMAAAVGKDISITIEVEGVSKP